MLISLVAVLFAVAGALVFLLAGNSPCSPTSTKVAELGRIAYAAAMIGLMVAYAAHTIKLG